MKYPENLLVDWNFFEVISSGQEQDSGGLISLRFTLLAGARANAEGNNQRWEICENVRRMCLLNSTASHAISPLLQPPRRLFSRPAGM
jgi:hypothetical protein